jgi:hypothetical protein
VIVGVAPSPPGEMQLLNLLGDISKGKKRELLEHRWKKTLISFDITVLYGNKEWCRRLLEMVLHFFSLP